AVKAYGKKESFLNPGGLVETYIDGVMVEMHDPDTGMVLFELAGGKGSPAAAMFAKTFSKKEPAVSIRKKQKNYAKIRAGYADTKSGAGMSASKLKKGDRSLPAKEKKARRKTRATMAPVKAAMRKLAKGVKKQQAGGSLKKGAKFTPKGNLKIGNLRAGGGKKKLSASFDFDLNNLLIEDETGHLYNQYDGSLVGGMDEDGDLFLYDEDGDPVWITEDDDEDDDEYEFDGEYEMDEMEVGAHGGGQPVALRMKGSGPTQGIGTFGSHGGGDAKQVKRKQGSPGGMRGGGTTEDESYNPYVARLESQITRQQEIIDAYQDLQRAEALESAKSSILGSHPELRVVESRLDRCQSAEEMRVEAEALLTLVESSRDSRPWKGGVAGGGVNSGAVSGAPDASLLTEEQTTTGFDAALSGSSSSDTASRVAAARRRRLDETQN
ncbi:MAG TPA: hypothetical protein VMZ50_05385, partial [Phycisphaerae bacterium]|nr:hypothetical protein [Phycisphaerae bacterium]